MNSKTMTWVEKVNNFFSLPMMMALKNGMVRLMPFTIVGSIFILLGNFPITGWSDMMAGWFGPDWKVPISQVQYATSDMLGLLMVFSIAYEYAKVKEVEPLACASIALACFLILIPGFAAGGDGAVVENAIPKSWIGGSGTCTAIVVAIVMGWLYCAILKKNIVIRLPESVPANVANSFVALIPGGACIILAFFVCVGARAVANISFAELVYEIIQTPLQSATGSIGGIIVMSLLMNFVWFFGIHSSVIGSMFNPFLNANAVANQAIADAGLAVTVANGAYIVTSQYNRQFMSMTGSGVTVGLVLAMVFVAKSARYRSLGKIALPATVFSINEPVLFGFPVAYNPQMLIPFVLTPLCGILTGYIAQVTGFLPLFTNVNVPWTTPAVISGFIIGGWRLALIQILIIAESFFIYFPFFKKFDREAYLAEQKGEIEE